jgi:hypothetical protein
MWLYISKKYEFPKRICGFDPIFDIYIYTFMYIVYIYIYILYTYTYIYICAHTEILLVKPSSYHQPVAIPLLQMLFSMAAGHWIVSFWEDTPGPPGDVGNVGRKNLAEKFEKIGKFSPKIWVNNVKMSDVWSENCRICQKSNQNPAKSPEICLEFQLHPPNADSNSRKMTHQPRIQQLNSSTDPSCCFSGPMLKLQDLQCRSFLAGGLDNKVGGQVESCWAGGTLRYGWLK